MAYNQYGQWVDDSGYSPTPGAGMPSVSTGGAVLGPGGWSDQSPYRQVNDPRTAYQPLYGNHNHMDDEAALGGLLDQSGYRRNTPQRSQTLQLLQGLQQQRQPLQQLVQPGIYQQDPTQPYASQYSQYGGASQGRGGAVDNVYTGHGTEKLPENSRVTGMVQEVNRLLYGGSPMEGSLVTANGVTRMAPMQAQPQLTDDERQAKFWQYIQPKLASGQIDAENASQLHSHAFGVDPQAYAASKQKQADEARKAADDITSQNMKVAVEKDRVRQALERENEGIQKTVGTNLNDFAVTYNSDPRNHPNQYYIGAKESYQDSEGKIIPKTEAEWKDALPSLHARVLNNLQQLGGANDEDYFAARQARLKAREQELLAKAGGASQSGQQSPPQVRSEPSGGVPGFGPFSPQAFGDPASAPTPFIRDTRSNLNAIMPWLRAGMSLPGRVSSGIRSGLGGGLNAADQYFMGTPPPTPPQVLPPVAQSAHMALIGGEWRMVDAQGNVMPYGQ